MTKLESSLSEAQRARVRLEKLSWLLDDAIRIPGTQIKIGLDSIVGLVPGVGDIAGLFLGAGIVYQGIRLDAPRQLIAKMLGNLAADALGGLVPVLGDLFDFAFKSNRRNAALLIAHLDALEPRAQALEPRNRVLGLLVLVALIGGSMAAIISVWRILLTA